MPEFVPYVAEEALQLYHPVCLLLLVAVMCRLFS